MTEYFGFPPDMTTEEIFLIELVKKRMLQKLTDRQKFIFIYCFELGQKHKEAADVLGVNETNVSRQVKRIRNILTPFKKGYM